MKKDRSKIYSDFLRVNRQLKKKLMFFESENYDIDDAIQIIEEISNILRKAVEGKGSLFSQLNYDKHLVFPNYQAGEMGSNLVREQKLVSMFISNVKSGFKSKTNIESQWFSDIHYWWNEIVVNDKHDVLVTRRDIVKTVADKEGGAHYDPEYNYEYYKMCVQDHKDIKSDEIIYKNLYFCSLLTIAQEYLYATEQLNLILRSRLVSENVEKDVCLMLRQYPTKGKFPQYQFNILDTTKFLATRIFVTLEKEIICENHLYDSYIHEYIDGFTNSRFQMRVFNTNQKNTEISYIIDVNRGITAIGKSSKDNKFILFSDSKVSKLENSFSQKLLNEERIASDEYSYKLTEHITFKKRKDAKKFIVGKYRSELNWGEIILYDPAKSIAMADTIKRNLEKLSDSVVHLYESVKSICEEYQYIFRFSIRKFDDKSNFTASHNLDRRSKVVEITINEEKFNDTIVSKVLLYAKLQLNGFPKGMVKENSGQMNLFFGSRLETFCQDVVIRQIQDEDLKIDRLDEVEEYANSIKNNTVQIENKVEYKYNALFKILSYINLTQNYEEYYSDIETYGEIFEIAKKIYSQLNIPNMKNPLSYRNQMVWLMRVLKDMLIKDGIVECKFERDLSIEYIITEQELNQLVSDIFEFEEEDGLITMISKVDNQASYYISGENIDTIKKSTIRDFYGISN